jgi:hypothetical protein
VRGRDACTSTLGERISLVSLIWVWGTLGKLGLV